MFETHLPPPPRQVVEYTREGDTTRFFVNGWFALAAAAVLLGMLAGLLALMSVSTEARLSCIEHAATAEIAEMCEDVT